MAIGNRSKRQICKRIHNSALTYSSTIQMMFFNRKFCASVPFPDFCQLRADAFGKPVLIVKPFL
jgi:hypothetical protein